MKKLLILAIILVLVPVVAVIISKEVFVESLLKNRVEAITGLRLTIEDVDVGLSRSTIKIKNLILFNPAGYEEKRMAEIPEIILDYDPGALLRGNIRFRKVRLDLRKLCIIKDSGGRVNVASLKKVRMRETEVGGGEGQIKREEEKTEVTKEKAKVAKERRAKKSSFKIDRLELKVGRVIYMDRTPEAPLSRVELNLNVSHTFRDITSPEDLARIVLVGAVARTAITDLIGGFF